MRSLFLAITVMSILGGCVTMPVDAVSNTPRAEAPQTVNGKEARFVATAKRVEPMTEALCAKRAPTRNCDFLIVIDDTPGAQANAYQTVDKSGRPIIAFTTAMLGEIQNEDEFAFVLAHEAAHHILGHLERTQMNANVGALVFGRVAGALGNQSAYTVDLARQIGAEVAARTYSKDYELEADSLAVEITKNAGYDPIRGAAFFFRLPDPGDRFLGTHPSNGERIRNVEQRAAAS